MCEHVESQGHNCLDIRDKTVQLKVKPAAPTATIKPEGNMDQNMILASTRYQPAIE